MFKDIISYISKLIRRPSNKYTSQKALEEYLKIEGITYADLFPPKREEK